MIAQASWLPVWFFWALKCYLWDIKSRCQRQALKHTVGCSNLENSKLGFWALLVSSSSSLILRRVQFLEYVQPIHALTIYHGQFICSKFLDTWKSILYLISKNNILFCQELNNLQLENVVFWQKVKMLSIRLVYMYIMISKYGYIVHCCL